MPYDSVADLPSAVRAKLKGKKLRQWMHVWNSSHARHGDESRAFAEAWATVQKMEKIMTDFNFFLPIAKVDEKKRTVSGYASTPTKDSDGEIVTLEAVRSALPDYMSWGNIREMHALKAVGVAKEANMDTKGLFLTAKIVDDAAWNKCLEGVYKGFSIGGRKLAKEGDKITEIELTEVSVVDRPANPDCKITLAKSRKEHAEGYLLKAKSDKTAEQKALVKMAKAVELLAKDGPPAAHDGFSLPAGAVDKAIPETAIPTKEPDGIDSPNDERPEENVTRKTEPDTTKGGDAPGDGSKPYGDVEYADPGHQSDGKKRYPVDNEKHIRAAWSYINKPKNAGKYSPAHASSVRSRIVSAWKKKIHPDGPPSVSKKIAKKLKKLEKRQRMAEFLNNRFALRRAAPALEIPEAESDSLEKFELRKSGEENMEDNKEEKVEFAKTGDPLADAVATLLAKASEPNLAKRLAMADDNVRKARKAMKECRKAIESAHKMHKAAYFAKADGAKPSDGADFDHAGAMEKLQKAYGELDKARIFGKAAIGDIAKASGRAGQSGQEAHDAEPGYYEVPAGVKPLAPSSLYGAAPGGPSGGSQPPAYPDDGGVYPGKAGKADDLRKYIKDGKVSAEVAELLIAKGRSDAELEALRRIPASTGRRPYAFDITKAVGDGVPREDNRSLFDGVDVGAIGSGDERAHTEASAKVIGNLLTSGKFGKSVLDPTFRGAAGSK